MPSAYAITSGTLYSASSRSTSAQMFSASRGAIGLSNSATSSLGSSRLRRLSTLWHVLTVMRISHGRTASQLRSVWMCA